MSLFRSREFWFTVLLFATALLARVGNGAMKPGYGTTKVHFEFETAKAATSLVQNGYLGDIYPTVHGPSAHVSPIYPMLLAALRWPFGVHSQFALIGQSVMSCAFAAWAIALLPALARAAGLRAASGWIAGFALAVVPIPTFYDDILGCWEQPLATLIAELLLLWLLRRCGQPWSARASVGLGVGFGLLALTSPGVLPAVWLPAVLVWWRSGSWKRRGTMAVVVAVAFSCVLLPWIVRNANAFGTFIPLRSNFPLELAIGNHDAANGRTYITKPGDHDSPFFRMHPFTSEAEQHQLREVGEVAYMAEKREQALSWIRANPGRFAELCGVRFALFFAPTADLWANSPSALWRSAITSAYSIVGLLGGAVLLLKRRSVGLALLMLYLVGSVVVYSITHMDLRYRSAVNGVLAVLALEVLLAVVWKRLFSKAAD